MEKPIPFNTEMVKAILGGRKTQTRRIVKPQPKTIVPDSKNRFPLAFWADNSKWIKPPYQPGDILYSRETWKKLPDGNYGYKASPETCRYENFELIGNWKPSVHMPREAARLFLRVTNVRVERLQEITDEDCWDEGVIGDPYDYQHPEYYEQYPGESYNRSCFLGLWNSIYGKKYPWKSNPFCWVIEFEVIKAPANC